MEAFIQHTGISVPFLRPNIDIAKAPTLIPSVAVAVADAIAAFVPDPDAVEIKWPNDVLLRGVGARIPARR